MKYEKPEITTLTDAIYAIQQVGSKATTNTEDSGLCIPVGCYEDNE
jgi:hypothetical protein